MDRPVALPVLAILAASLMAVSPLPAQVERQTLSTSSGTLSVSDALLTLQGLIDQPTPAGIIGPTDLRAYQAQTEWFRTMVTRLTIPRDAATGQASGKRQHSPITIRKEIEAVRKAIEEESKKFTMLSNILKTRHDAAMSAIRNMK